VQERRYAVANCVDVPQLIPRIAHGNGGTR
jgi:hypothetical protein